MDEKRLDDAIDVLTQRVIDTDGWVSAKKISALARLIESRSEMKGLELALRVRQKSGPVKNQCDGQE